MPASNATTALNTQPSPPARGQAAALPCVCRSAPLSPSPSALRWVEPSRGRGESSRKRHKGHRVDNQDAATPHTVHTANLGAPDRELRPPTPLRTRRHRPHDAVPLPGPTALRRLKQPCGDAMARPSRRVGQKRTYKQGRGDAERAPLPRAPWYPNDGIVGRDTSATAAYAPTVR